MSKTDIYSQQFWTRKVGDQSAGMVGGLVKAFSVSGLQTVTLTPCVHVLQKSSILLLQGH